MKKGYCDICGNPSNNAWALVLAEYDSLRFDKSLRMTLCCDCANKMAGALRAVTVRAEEDSPVIICPGCRERVKTQDPKIARPCPKCATIFSGYSAWVDRREDYVAESVRKDGNFSAKRAGREKRIVGD